MVGFVCVPGSDGRAEPTGSGSQRRVGMVWCGRRDDGSWRAYASVSRRAGRFDRKDISCPSTKGPEAQDIETY